ncbi:MAG: hypothetical protein ACQEWI_08880 [Bacillota bacterium]
MNKRTKFLYIATAALMLAGCSGKSTATDESTSTKEVKESDTQGATPTSSEGSESVTSDSTSSEDPDSNVEDMETKEPLSQYSSEQIEYVRVWLQLGPNQALDELNVRHLPAGEVMNPNDENSATYPENVIQLAGSRLVDGSVTYSGNGDGTINVYNVPLRWDGDYSKVGDDFYKDIIENTKLVYVDPGDDKKIIKLIELLNVHS